MSWYRFPEEEKISLYVVRGLMKDIFTGFVVCSVRVLVCPPPQKYYDTMQFLVKRLKSLTLRVVKV